MKSIVHASDIEFAAGSEHREVYLQSGQLIGSEKGRSVTRFQQIEWGQP